MYIKKLKVSYTRINKYLQIR